VGPATAGPLDASGPAEADRDRAVLHDHGDASVALGVPEHLVEPLLVLLDVVVIDRRTTFAEILTGGCGVRSRILAEDHDRSSHGLLLSSIPMSERA
jgi:hypothetical protein